MFKKNIDFRNILNQMSASTKHIAQQNSRIIKEINDMKLSWGRLMSNEVRKLGILDDIHKAEFKIFSQWGDDGIIQYLINQVNIPAKNFIEFGVENYTEANTRFLLLNDNWSGLVMDCSKENINYIKNDDIYWKHDLIAMYSFVTVENINKTISEAGFTGDIGLLHIDVDGNDYWIWKAIDIVSPIIVIIEYNSLFGKERAITIPYDPTFNRFEAHHSGIYAGASLLALCDLAQEKGYSFIGSNSAGNNAYFIRNDSLSEIKSITTEQGYVPIKFREHRNQEGHLTFLPGLEAIKQIRGMKVFNTSTNEIEAL